MKKFINEFRIFLTNGNTMDYAVGLIMGAAMQKIVNSFVSNILMPLVGMMLGGIEFEKLSVTVGDAELKYGLFIQTVIEFVLIGLAIFLIVRGMNRMRESAKKQLERKNKKASNKK